MTSKHLAFAVMATIWGLTWIAIKIGVEAVPPFLFAAARLVTAGAILLLLARQSGATLAIRGAYGRVFAASILVNTITYGMLFWGMQYVATGLSSVVNLALIPVGLFTIGLAAGEETYSRRKVGAIVLGVLGLVVLFMPKLSLDSGGDGDGLALVGMVALVVGTLAYCWGSILSRPLLRMLQPLALSGWLTLIGGMGLLGLAAAFEPLDRQTMSRFLELPILSSWLFLVLGGSIVAFTLYLRLLRDWGPTRAGMYAFVSPIIAVVLGVLVFNEPFGVYEVVGAAFMLSGAALAMLRPRSSVPTPQLASAGD